jgi:hydroxymethylbilane synthase
MRAEVRDALISANGSTIDTLPQNAVVGTSSLRRAAQLLAVRPDVKIESLRGNVDTRLRKALEGQYDAIVLAGAGLTRLGLDQHVTEWLPLDVMLPAPGQGALAVQCQSTDQTTSACSRR